MAYNVRFLYILTIIIGTFICIYYIEKSYKKIAYYYSYDAKTTGYIISKKCLDNLPENVKCYYKEYIVNTYNNQITLVCKSSSGGGISILVKVSTQLTQENFKVVN